MPLQKTSKLEPQVIEGIMDRAKVLSESYLGENPTREEIGGFLSHMANHYMLEIDQSAVWDYINEKHKFSKDEFYDDVTETIKKHGREAVEMYGLKNWKYKGK